MPDIKQLSEEVANQISAGEVVERPASVVKELVENSIDANSDRILIEIENGGKDLIRVKDNGIGIEKENIEKAFSRYATSKIEKISDLYSLNTLGFRGEALASISSVSKLTALSKAKDNLKGVKIVYHGGKQIKKETAACPEGTDIKVKDLFYNTPARYKYLKTKTTEFGHISKIITQESLSYPEVKFNLKHNGKNVLSTPGSDELKDAIYAIYGNDIFSNLHYLEFEDKYINVKGYISEPSLTRSSRIHEMFFVNKRAVYSRTLSKAVESAYKGLISKNKYPVVFLFVKLNPILVDVNVHPAKKQIKFSRNQIIKSVVKNGVKEKLNELNPAVQYKIKENKSEDKQVKREKNIEFKFSRENKSQKNSRFKNNVSENHGNNKNNRKKSINKNISIVDKKYYSNSNKSRNKKSSNIKKNNRNNNTGKYNKNLSKNNNSNNLKVKNIFGQIFLSYILVEAEKNFYIVDQHNAHERILYDNFYRKYENDKNISQKLLTPINLELTPSEVEILKNNENKIKNLGFEFEAFGGNSILIQSVPEIISEKSVKNELREIIDKLINEDIIQNSAEMVSEMIEFMACRSAVKADERLNDSEMERLVIDLFQSSNPFRCPHGRPIMIKMSREDIDKGVGR